MRNLLINNRELTKGQIRDAGVGGSNPLTPTTDFKKTYPIALTASGSVA